MSIENLIEKIDKLQKQTNDAIVKKETEISKKSTIDQDVKALQDKCIEEFGCEIKELVAKKEALEKEIEEDVKKLEGLLGIYK